MLSDDQDMVNEPPLPVIVPEPVNDMESPAEVANDNEPVLVRLIVPMAVSDVLPSELVDKLP